MISPDAVMWEAVLSDGTVQRQTDGVRYGDIDRSRLTSFRLVSPGEMIVEIFTRTGRGLDLCFRRRTKVQYQQGKKVASVVYLLGWVTLGPLYEFDCDDEELTFYQTWGDYPRHLPVPIPAEGENFTFSSVSHSIDARINDGSIV